DGPVHPVLREYDFDAVHGLTGKMFSGRIEPVTRIFRVVSEKPVFNEFRDGLFHFAQFVSFGVRTVRGGMELVGLKEILLVSSSRVFENGDACRRIFTSRLLISATSPGFIIAVASVASRVFRSSRKSSREIGKRKRFIHSWSPKNLNT